jgi:DNA (cytosine-5)-methyltransferase 1
LKFIDFFAGIGGFREGLERNGFECVGWCEIDKFKQQAYKVVHNTKGEWFKDDITTIQPGELPEADMYCGGFPCQSFSVAGRRGGFEDTRGTLFFEIMRLAKERQPKYLFLENVKGLLSHNGGKTFGTILSTMGELGYNAEYQVLNSKDFGVPQNRERVFIIGYLRGRSGRKVFPIRRKTQSSFKTIKQLNNFCGRIESKDGISGTLTKNYGMQSGDGTKIVEGLNTTKEGNSYCIDSNYYKGTSPGNINSGRRTHIKVCLTPNRINKRQNGRRFKDEGEPMFTLTGQDIHGVAYENRIRKLTPLECFRLQGFPDEWYYKCKQAGINDTQMYRAAGDSVTVNVIEEIGEKIIRVNQNT